jgi:hypothetical protein
LPIEIVEAPPAFPDAEYEGWSDGRRLAAAAAPELLADPESYAAWNGT